MGLRKEDKSEKMKVSTVDYSLKKLDLAKIWDIYGRNRDEE